MIQLEDRLYTSTEVADILGVSLRSVYRYIEENKLQAEVKTATGRHRFTKKNIVDFLYPDGSEKEKNPRVSSEDTRLSASNFNRSTSFRSEEESSKPNFNRPSKDAEIKDSPRYVREEKEIQSEKEEELDFPVTKAKAEEVTPVEAPVDWLAKFREAAKKFETEKTETEAPTRTQEINESLSYSYSMEKEPVLPKVSEYYYKSRLGGLKDIAQNLDKVASNSNLDYAFTLNAGLSLYKPIKPFSLLHAYIRSRDKDFFERVLMLTPVDRANAQLSLIVTDEDSLYDNAESLHGLHVVSKKKLLEDISKSGDKDLLEESANVLK